MLRFQPCLSRWAGYLSSLPHAHEWDGTALLWCEREGGQNASTDYRVEQHAVLDDVSAAALWLRGTEAEKHLTDERGRRLNVSAILKKRRSCSPWLCVPLRAGRVERLVSGAAGWIVIAYMTSPAARHTWFISNLASSELR